MINIRMSFSKLGDSVADSSAHQNTSQERIYGTYVSAEPPSPRGFVGVDVRKITLKHVIAWVLCKTTYGQRGIALPRTIIFHPTPKQTPFASNRLGRLDGVLFKRMPMSNPSGRVGSVKL